VLTVKFHNVQIRHDTARHAAHRSAAHMENSRVKAATYGGAVPCRAAPAPNGTATHRAVLCAGPLPVIVT